MKLFRRWLKKGNVNIEERQRKYCSQYASTSAEKSVLKGNKVDAVEEFNLASRIAAQNSFLHDKALAHELAGAYLKVQGDEYWYNYHMDCSRRSYMNWGASVKVNQFANQ